MSFLEVHIEEIVYAGRREAAVKDARFAAEKGEVVWLKGPTGCGKTTVLRCLNGLIPGVVEAEGRGEIVCWGEEFNITAKKPFPFKVHTVLQNPFHSFIAAGLLARNDEDNSGDWIMRRMSEAKSFRDLSAGERQRLLLREAFVSEGELLLLDEPLNRLDGQGVKAFIDSLREWKKRKEGVVIIAEHRREVMEGIADVIVEIPGERGDVNAGVFEKLEQAYRDYSGREGGRLNIELAGAGVKVEGRDVLKNVNLTIGEGEVIGIYGDNGAGKTTLALVLAGQKRLNSGSIKRGSNYRTGIVYDDPQIQLLCDTVEDEIYFSAENYGINLKYARALGEFFGLNELFATSPFTLSYGQQERMALCANLAGAPDLSIFDEPIQGQDEAGRGNLRIIIDFLRKNGKAAMIISHDLRFLEVVCDRVLLLQAGVLRPI